MELNCTYTRYHSTNINILELEKYFEQIGVRYNINSVITDIDWLKLDEKEIKDLIDLTYERLLKSFLNSSINTYVSSIINAIVYHEYSDYFCEDLCSGMIFDVDGECYPCNRLLKKCSIDNEELKKYNVKNNIMCEACWARGLCIQCTAGMFLHEDKIPYNTAHCNKREIYEYTLKKLLEYFHDNSEKFQLIIDNFYS